MSCIARLVVRSLAIRVGNRPAGFVASYCVTSGVGAVDTARRIVSLVFDSDGDDGRANE